MLSVANKPFMLKVYMLKVLMLKVFVLKVFVLSIVMLKVFMLSVFMLKVFMLSVIYADCHYAECHYAECHSCRVSFMLSVANKPREPVRDKRASLFRLVVGEEEKKGFITLPPYLYSGQVKSVF